MVRVFFFNPSLTINHMPFTKPTANSLADETFEADYLEDAFDDVMDFLGGNRVSDDNQGPETIIIIRNNVPGDDGKRLFTGAIYVGKTIDEIKTDLK